jgi:tetratricopeptide (TPR) repeat protein
VPVDSECAASRILAACPQGCPQKVLEDLIGETVTGDAYRLDIGPMGETRVTLSSEALRSVSRALTAAELAEIHRVLYDALPNEGWGYLRRQGHALASNDVNRILMNHHAFLRGIAWVGVDLLYRHYVGIAGSVDGAELAPESRLNALVGAARLATRVREGGGFSEAIQHFRDAIDVCQVPTRRVDLLNQLANVYAVQRDRQSLIEARALYARAFNDLEGLPDDEERFRLAIRLLNGLALVEYHEGHDVEALRLEEQAREVANQGQERFPRIGQWANILLNLNSAKLLEKRFGDLEGAIRMLRDNLSLGAVEDRFRSATELAHLHLDHGRHSDVVEVLAPFYEGEDVSYLDQDMELFGRGMLVVSLLACNAPERALKQKRRLEVLSRTGRGPVVEEFFKKFLASIHADSAGSGVSSSSS